MVKKFVFITLLALLALLPGPGLAEGPGIATLEQAVSAARAMNFKPETSKEGTAIDAAQTNKIALEVAETVINLDFSIKKLQYLEARKESLRVEAEKADNEFRMGRLDAKTRDELKKAVTQNSFDLNYYKMQAENGRRSFQRLTGAPVSEDFLYSGAYLIADAGKLSLPDQGGLGGDVAQLEKKLGEVVKAYSDLGLQVGTYIDAAEKLAKTEEAFKTGKAKSEEVDAAGSGKYKAMLAALEAKAAYSKLLYELDCSLNGYISREVKKLPNPIFVVPGA